VHGKVDVEVQRFLDRETGNRLNYFELTGQFADGYLTASLQEWSAYYSNRMSYEEVMWLLERLNGERLLSDQRIEQLVIEKAVEISAQWVSVEEVSAEALPAINPEVAIYEAEEPEIRLFEDGIGVKGQKSTRQHSGKPAADLGSAGASTSRVISDVALLECRDGHHQYLCEGIDAQGQCCVSLEQRVRQAVQAEYGDQPDRLNVVAISDGASHIRQSVQEIFGQMPTVILDWYHLRKKTRELMSMIAMNKTDKERHLPHILSQLWSGAVDSVLDYLRTQVQVRNAAKHEEFIGYLEKHRHEIIDYEKRQNTGKPVGSGRMEKGVDQVIGHRQKKKGMAWSAKGSKALAILKVVELNGLWQQLWWPKQQLEAAA